MVIRLCIAPSHLYVVRIAYSLKPFRLEGKNFLSAALWTIFTLIHPHLYVWAWECNPREHRPFVGGIGRKGALGGMMF